MNEENSDKVLSSYIANYRFKYRRGLKRNKNPSDILNVINRLKQYKKYQAQIRKERKIKIQKKEDKIRRKILKEVRRESFRQAFADQLFKPVSNPYIDLIIQARREGKKVVVDPNLEKKYKSMNIYTLWEFRGLPLPRSDYEIKAGQAWGGLKKAWTGYKISKRLGSDLFQESYARATQNFAHLLELPMIPDFADLGASLEDFLKMKKESSNIKIL